MSSGPQSGADTDDRGPYLPWPRLHCCRFESLQEPLRERREALEARSRLSQFFRDAEEEMAWVQERLPLAATQDCGQSLSAVRHLQEKHQVWEPSPPRAGRGCPQIEHTTQSASGAWSSVPLAGLWGYPRFFVGHMDGELFGGRSVGDCEASSTTLGPPEERPVASWSCFPPPPQNLESEISSHEALTQAVVDAGHKLVRAGHSACDVAVRVQQLENAMGSLRAQVTQRRLLLQQAQEAQQFLTEVRGRCEMQKGRAWA